MTIAGEENGLNRTRGADNGSTSTCEDGHSCYNGGLCTADQVQEGSYWCDCKAIFIQNNKKTQFQTSSGQATNLSAAIGPAYTGVSCEFPATVYCNVNNIPNMNSFCANNGHCNVNVTLDSTKHLGCTCPGDYSGPFCQFVKNQKMPTGSQENEKKSASAGVALGNSGNASRTVFPILLIVILAVLFAFFFVVYRRKHQNRKELDTGDGSTVVEPAAISPSEFSNVELEAQREAEVVFSNSSNDAADMDNKVI